MEIDTQDSCMFRVITLCEQGKQESGEHIAAAGRGHARIARGVEKLPAVGKCHHRVMPFEDKNHRVALCKQPGSFQSIKVIGRFSRKTFKFGKMRGQDAIRREECQPCLILRQHVQSVGINDKRQLHRVEDVLHCRHCLLCRSQSGAESHRRDIFGQSVPIYMADILFVVINVMNRFRQGYGKDVAHRAHRMHGEFADAATHSRSGRQHRRTRHPVTARHQESVPESAFMGGFRTGAQHCTHIC